METIHAKDWDDFLAKATELRVLVTKRQGAHRWSPLLFRGQANACWRLNTTLDRYTKTPMTMKEYYQAIHRIKDEVETFTNANWVVNFDEAREWCNTLPLGKIPAYEYMAFLRHNGFPSPLLDWTASEAIAAFFAFREPPAATTDNVSIYAYCNTVTGMTASSSDYPSINYYGHTIKTHPRHILQQCHYTTCTIFKDYAVGAPPMKRLTFAPHDEVGENPFIKQQLEAFERAGASTVNMQDQNLLWKINIPAVERGKALTYLYKYNLHAFSLFNSTEALAEKLAFEHLGPYDLRSYLGSQDKGDA